MIAKFKHRAFWRPIVCFATLSQPSLCFGKPSLPIFSTKANSIINKHQQQTATLTINMSSTQHKHTNRLINETSPYLLQHAHNPVDWCPWGTEAFQKAKNENKPIFLSVGYSTCHWCHVMERESFESEEIARLMNDNFVNIKVDREERPDVDRVYMTFVQATTGGGGWPMSVFLTPDLKPFFGGTYFPPREQMFSRMPSFPTILKRLAQLWKTSREKVVSQSEEVMNALRQDEDIDIEEDSSPAHEIFKNAETYLKSGYKAELRVFDSKLGGFGGAPKFPRPVIFNFLFRQVARLRGQDDTTADQILQACLFTLKQMARGGMYDHLGGGFHRYSVDKEWHVPHFEKMTYDQGQLLVSYVEAYQITRDPFFARVAREIMTYMVRDMTLNGEAFFSAEDADSYPHEGAREKREGAFYAWTYDEVEKLLQDDKRALDLLCYVFDVRHDGNVKSSSDPHGELTGQNVLIMRRTVEDAATHFNMSIEDTEQLLQRAKERLFHVREKRPRPHLDDKIITAWNGLMISGFARAAQVLGDNQYATQAEKAASFIRNKLFDANEGILMRSYREGSRATPVPGYLNDYCFLIQALLDLYEATGKLSWLQWAMQLQEKQNDLFGDKERGGYFEVTGKDESILLRMKEDYDGAEPSGNSVAAMNLIRLAQYSQQRSETFMNWARKSFVAFGRMIQRAPQAVPQLMCALDEVVNPGKHIAIVYDDKVARGDVDKVLQAVHEKHNPSKTLFYVNRSDSECMKFVKDEVEYLSEASVRDNKPTVYICQNFACQAPLTDITKLRELL